MITPRRSGCGGSSSETSSRYELVPSVRRIVVGSCGCLDSVHDLGGRLSRRYMVPALDEWWNRGDACDADGVSYCARCKPSPFPETVYVTRGGSAFHSRRDDCLQSGQEFVEAKGGSAAPIESVNRRTAARRNYQTCLGCSQAEGRP